MTPETTATTTASTVDALNNNPEIARYVAKLETMRKTQEYYKAVNKAVKAKGATGETILTALTAAGYGGSVDATKCAEFLKPDFAGRVGIASYVLTNASAEMRRLEKRIKELEAKTLRSLNGNKEFPFEGGRVVVNYDEDRIQIFHDEKPSEDVRKAFKARGFNWSPSNDAWQRQITSHTAYDASQLTGITVTL